MRFVSYKKIWLWALILTVSLPSCNKAKLEAKVAAGAAVNCDTTSSSKSASCSFQVSVTQANPAATEATVSWTKPDRASGAVTYKVYRSSDNTLSTSTDLSSNATLVSDAGSSTSASATSLTPSQNIYFYVVATDAKGRVFLSDPVAYVGTAEPPAPGGSGTLTIPGGSVTTTSMTIQWAEATAADGSHNVTYDVYQSTSNNMGTLADTLANGTRLTSSSLAAGTTSYAVTGLLPTSTYYFTVVVTDAQGNQSIYTTTSGATSPDTTAPTVGGGGTISNNSIGASGFTANWTAATDDINSAALLQYRVYYSTANNITTAANAQANGTAANAWTSNITSLAITGLSPSTTYYVNVLVRDTTGNITAYSSASQATTADITSPTVTTSALSYSAPIATGFTVSWTAASDNVTPAASLQYIVYTSTANNITTPGTAASNGTAANAYTANITSLNVTGLSPTTTYYVQVLVKDAAGNISAYASTSTTTTSDTTNPAAGGGGGISYASVGVTGFTANWTAATDNVTPAASLQYRVYYSTSNNITTAASAVANGTAANAYTSNITTLAITGLTPSTTYYVQVLVKDAAGNVGVYTSSSQATAADTTAPTAGGGGSISYSGVTSSQVTLTWTAATDNATAATSLQYRVYYSTSNNITTATDAVTNGTAANAYTTNITTLNVTGLSASTTYYFQVLVKDASNNVGIYTSSSQATSAGGGGSSATDRTIFTCQSPFSGVAMGSSGSTPLIPVTSTYGADAQCKIDGALPGAAALPNSKWNWNALVGINGYSIRNRFNLPAVSFKTPNSQTIATSETQLFTQALTNTMSCDYAGVTQPGWGTTWTGKSIDWTQAESGSVSCNDWSSGTMTDSGRNGNGAASNAQYWLGGQNQAQTCDSTLRFYCISTPPAYIFVTSTTHNGNLGGASGADSICQTRGAAGTASSTLGVQKWRAVISRNAPYNSMTPRQGLSLPYNTQVYLVDNSTKVADHSSQLFNDGTLTLSAAVQKDENGTSVPSATAWTGDVANTCTYWTDSGSGTAAVGHTMYSDSNWLANTSSVCSATQRIYCIGQ